MIGVQTKKAIKIVKSISLQTRESGPFAQELLKEHILNIEKAVGGPPAGAKFVIVEEQHLHLSYLAYSVENVEYVLEVLDHLSTTN